MRTWKQLNEQEQNDLLTWYNLSETDAADRRKLAALLGNGQFHAWDCPLCGERVYYGNPDNWDDYQGVCQADYCSYPGCTDYYTARLVSQMCDQCRMNSPAVKDTNETGAGEPACWEPEAEGMPQ
jgi:hypothetical protein